MLHTVCYIQYTSIHLYYITYIIYITCTYRSYNDSDHDGWKKNIWHGQHKIGHYPRPAFRGFGFGVRKKANKNAGSRLGMTNRLDNPNVNKVFLYTTSYKPIRHVFRTIVWLNLTGDWDIWHDMMWHDVTKGSGLEMMAVKREKAVNASLTIHRISQCIQSLFETMGKIGKTHTVTWIKYCSKYSMCLLPGEGLLYCFFPFFFPSYCVDCVVGLRISATITGWISGSRSCYPPGQQAVGLSWPAQIFFGVLVLDVLVLITATYVQAASLVQPRRATSIHGSCHFKSSCRRLSWATLIAG